MLEENPRITEQEIFSKKMYQRSKNLDDLFIKKERIQFTRNQPSNLVESYRSNSMVKKNLSDSSTPSLF